MATTRRTVGKRVVHSTGKLSCLVVISSYNSFCTIIGNYKKKHRSIMFCLQKIIYKQMKITGAVRVIKRQEVLPDGSTLDEHGIIDGSTVNIVIEPEKEISIKMKLGPKEFTQKVSNSMCVRELKQQLIDGDIVGFSINEFQLLMPGVKIERITDFTLPFTAVDNDRITMLLRDESLPLHLYGMDDNTRIKIVGWSIRIQLINQKGEKCFKYFPRKMTVKEMKKEIQAKHISLFLKRGTNYRKLDDEAPIEDVLFHKAVVYYIEDKFFKPKEMVGVFHKDVKIEKIGHVHNETAQCQTSCSGTSWIPCVQSTSDTLPSTCDVHGQQ